ncbi:peptidoglycan DD-metalloendopeptidase family protein [candidate division KSB1 bacterium]|nr:peptidoglycan DD-metalloendopeptidase family protein [candidate division KSB1 bacterium]
MFCKFLVWLLWIYCFLGAGILSAQNRTERHHEKLRKARNEIRAVQKEIEANNKDETSVLYMLTNLDLDIDLAHSVIQNLKKGRKKKESQISKISKNLKTTQQELERLKEIFRKRLVYIYKYGRFKDIELLLTAKSINDGLLWVEYQKRLSENDYRNYLQIKEKQTKITRDQSLLTIELKEKKKLLRNKINEEAKLKTKKNERQKVLTSIRKNTDLLRQRLIEKEHAAKEIASLIAGLERAPKQTPLPKPGTLFSELRGLMIWPTEGRIVTRFGKVKHPELKTFTENIGIEIKAPEGNPVQVVAKGKITTITWQRGRGNIVIVSHYGGYYTVYTHLREILVDLLDDVKSGQVIGSVGESGSLKGPILHFEVWKGTTKLNPENWLAKST